MIEPTAPTLSRRFTIGLPCWSFPFGYAAGAFVLGITIPRFEARFLPDWTSQMTVAAAMAIYSAVATGMIALTGVVFSIVFVMVQFSSVAYSPRLVLWLSRDPLLFHAIGVFTATFLYAIAALAWVDRVGSGKVPLLSVSMLVGLLLISVGVLVGLVLELERLQIDKVLRFTGDFGRSLIEKLYPLLDSTCGESPNCEFRALPVTQRADYRGPPRVIQSLDLAALTEL